MAAARQSACRDYRENRDDRDKHRRQAHIPAQARRTRPGPCLGRDGKTRTAGQLNYRDSAAPNRCSRAGQLFAMSTPRAPRGKWFESRYRHRCPIDHDRYDNDEPVDHAVISDAMPQRRSGQHWGCRRTPCALFAEPRPETRMTRRPSDCWGEADASRVSQDLCN